MTAKVKEPSPFVEIPSGIAIAHYFWEETDHRNPGCEGIDLWRGDGTDYCYLWVEAVVDLDMWEAYLLDIRTHVNVPPGEMGETRDYLFLFVGTGDRFDVEWLERPYAPFRATSEEHWKRFERAMAWFASKIEKSVEDADDAAKER